MKAIIHIGLNKTGTSSIQRFLHENRQQLLQHGYYYPEPQDHSCAHHAVAREVEKTGKSDPLNALVSEAKRHGADLLLSSEHFHTLKDLSPIRRSLRGLKREVVVYVREHTRYMTSWYQQSVQSQVFTSTFPEFIQQFSKPHMPVLQAWKKIADRKGMFIKGYQRENLPEGDVRHDFLERLGISDRADFNFPEDSNLSITGNLLLAKRILNNFLMQSECLEAAHEVTRIAEKNGRYTGTLNIGDEMINKIYWMYEEDRKALRSKYGIALGAPPQAKGTLVPDEAHVREDWQSILGTAQELDGCLWRAAQRGGLDRMLT